LVDCQTTKKETKYVEDALAEEIITKISSGDEIFMDIEEVHKNLL
jgi:hypothetical protein